MRLKIICCLLSTVPHKLSPTAFLLLPKYYQATISRLPPTYHYLSLPATTHLQLPATSCLLRTFCLQNASTYQYLPMLPPARIRHCHYLSLHATACHYPQTHSLRLHRLKLYNRPGCQTTLIGSSWKTLIGKEYLLFGLFFETLVFGQQHLPKMAKKKRFFGRKGLRKRSVASGPPFPGEDPFATPSDTVNSNRSEPWHRKKHEFSSC